MYTVSVIICTRNPRHDYFRRVLDALDRQTLSKEFWELLLVDNGSAECVAATWSLSWHPRGRQIREETPGLTPARLRGIQESCGDLLVFVDDDNVLAPDFLDVSSNIMAEHPNLGVFGPGILQPEFEVEPPPELVPYLPMLALRNVQEVKWSNNLKDHETIPWGAGLCVTRSIADHYPELVDQLNVDTLLDRREQRLFAGGDDLFSAASVATGKGFGLFSELRVTHLISSGRLTQSYFLRLLHDHAFSHGVLRYLMFGVQPHRNAFRQYVRFLWKVYNGGLFSARCQWAVSRGEKHARRLIAERRLQAVSWLPTQSPYGVSLKEG